MVRSELYSVYRSYTIYININVFVKIVTSIVEHGTSEPVQSSGSDQRGLLSFNAF